MQLSILRNAVEVARVEIDERTVFTHKLMGEHKIVSDFIANKSLPVQIGDYIIHGNEKFYINTPPELEKLNNFTYRYVIEFEGEIYRLYSKIFMDEGQADFSYHGTPETFLLLLLENINSTDAGWTIEKVDEAVSQTLSFNNSSCRTALTTIAEAFNLEFRLVNKAIYLERSVGADTTLQFEYGRGLGLYTLARNKIEDKNVVTRVYGFGARKNLKFDYRGGASRLVFEERKLEANTELYGIREGSVTFDEIYPNRTGTVSAIDAEDIMVINDASLNFDINQFLLEGTTAKIVFKSGALSGYEFEIQNYRHADRRIKFIPFVEENGYTLPNDLNFPEIGDEYTLVDINMPQIYIDEAEAKLKERTQTYLDENSTPRVLYTLSIDEKYVRERGIELKVADLVRVLDTGLGINSKIRVSEVSYPIINPDMVTALIADSIPYTIQEQLIADNVDNNIEIVNVDRQRVELARRSALRFRELASLISDPDGYFDPVNIKPFSIETYMLSVGARSQNFGLIGVTIQANYEGNPNTLFISGGQLAHYEIEIEGLGYVWEMDPVTFANLDPEKHYYVYARCSSTSLTGEWAISEEPQRVDAEPGHYLFNLGILYKVLEGRRDFDFTNGMTYINGDTITTGRIKSLDGLNFFDLSSSQFRIGNDESYLDYNVSEAGRLTLKGVLVSSFIIADGASIENLSVRSLRTRDEGRRLEILESENNLVLYDDDGNEVVRIDDGVDSPYSQSKSPGISAQDINKGIASSLSANGIFANGGNILDFVNINASNNLFALHSSISGQLQPGGSSSFFIKAAVSGVNDSIGINRYGGYFSGGLRVDGGGNGLEVRSALHLNTENIFNTTFLKDDSYFCSCYNSNGINIYLPKNPVKGRHIKVRRNIGNVTVYGEGSNMVREGVESSVGIKKGDVWSFHWDGSYWLCNYQGRTS